MLYFLGMRKSEVFVPLISFKALKNILENLFQKKSLRLTLPFNLIDMVLVRQFTMSWTALSLKAIFLALVSKLSGEATQILVSTVQLLALLE